MDHRGHRLPVVLDLRHQWPPVDTVKPMGIKLLLQLNSLVVPYHRWLLPAEGLLVLGNHFHHSKQLFNNSRNPLDILLQLVVVVYRHSHKPVLSEYPQVVHHLLSLSSNSQHPRECRDNRCLCSSSSSNNSSPKDIQPSLDRCHRWPVVKCLQEDIIKCRQVRDLTKCLQWLGNLISSISFISSNNHRTIKVGLV